MNKIKTFIHIFVKSLTSVDYYKDVLSSGLKFSLNYFITLSAISIVITATAGALRIAPTTANFVNDLTTQATQAFPQDLVIKVENGTWEINRPQPFIVAMPKDLVNLAKETSTAEVPAPKIPQNLAIFNKTGTVEDIKKLDALMLVNEKNIITQDQDGNIQTQPLENLKTINLDKPAFDKAMAKAKELGGLIPVIIGLIIAVGSVIGAFIRAVIYLSFGGLVIWLISRATRLKWSFKQAYKVGLHTITAPLIIETLFSVLGISIASDYWFFLINVALAGLVSYTLSRQPQVESGK